LKGDPDRPGGGAGRAGGVLLAIGVVVAPGAGGESEAAKDGQAVHGPGPVRQVTSSVPVSRWRLDLPFECLNRNQPAGFLTGRQLRLMKEREFQSAPAGGVVVVSSASDGRKGAVGHGYATLVGIARLTVVPSPS